MSTVFPLFSLPYLPLKEVFDHFEPQGILIISLCSERSKNYAISYRGPSKNIRIGLNSGANSFLRYYEDSTFFGLFDVTVISNLPKVKTLETVKIGNYPKVPVIMGTVRGLTCLKTYWEYRFIGLEEIINYARKIFNRDIYHMTLGKQQTENDHRLAVNLIMKIQNSIPSIYCDFPLTNHADLDMILENCNTQSLELFVWNTKDYSPAKQPNFNLDSVYIHHSYWIKPNHFMAMNCKYIALQESLLTNEDINTFLKHWMNGGCYPLKELIIRNEEPEDYEDVLDGWEFTAIDDEVKRDFVNDEEDLQSIYGGSDIKRPIDNVTATIINSPREFWMIVWPDYAGNSHRQTGSYPQL
ncbi:hypothetical protein CRE_26651 [Caenorhabditis remanei]|uniref:Sdz-33 F-box domain-containing protein n=1 Tax=Caenorhabditis remanei TaxID=31234 RepID=E3ML27_CAERE|nr:hypothetical protein CRE_26651 [Caenorhabditis remanei]